MKFFYVTQDGVARTSLKDKKLDGLFTDKVETCVVWLIKGEKHVTMIHDTKSLSPQAIRHEISRVGKLNRLYVFYNPDPAYNSAMLTEDYVRAVTRDTFVKSVKLMFLECENGFVEVILRDFKIKTNNKADKSYNHNKHSFVNPVDLEHRKIVNIFNNLFLLDNEYAFPDLQYEHKIQENVPKLNKDLDVMLNILLSLNKNKSDFIMNFAKFMLCHLQMNIVDGSYSNVCKKILDCIESQNIQYDVFDIIQQTEPDVLDNKYNKQIIDERDCYQLENIIRHVLQLVSTEIVTSQNIVNRIEHQYFAPIPNKPEHLIPNTLIEFKNNIVNARSYSSNIIATLPELPNENLPKTFTNFKHGNLANAILGSLINIKLGIGECYESCIFCVQKLIALKINEVVLVEMRLSNYDMPNPNHPKETRHLFVVVNFDPTKANGMQQNMSKDDFFALLPENAYIIDPFLQVFFQKHEVHPKFVKYVDTYIVKVNVFLHLYNVTSRFFYDHEFFADKLVDLVKKNAKIKPYDYLTDKHNVQDTSMIIYLKALTKLHFFALCNGDFDVDAVLDVTKQENANHIEIYPSCQSLLPYGKFFTTNDNRRLFVIQKINAENNEYEQNVGKEIYSKIIYSKIT